MGHVPQRAEAGEGMHSVGLKDWIRRWPTPTVDDSSNVTRESGSFQSPTRAVREAWEPEPTEEELEVLDRPRMYPTPGANEDSYRLGGDSQQSNSLGAMARREAISEGGSGQLNPTWVEWLMGFPAGWTDCEHLGTPSFRKSLKRSGGGS